MGFMQISAPKELRGIRAEVSDAFSGCSQLMHCCQPLGCFEQGWLFPRCSYGGFQNFSLQL